MTREDRDVIVIIAVALVGWAILMTGAVLLVFGGSN